MNNKSDDNFFAEERKQMIVETVNKNIKTTVNELCEKFSVSPATVRNDLRELEEAGLLKRTHGGAICNNRATFEPNAYQKEVERIEQKRAIAGVAAAYVNEGDTIALDTGTTTFELAKLLVGFKNLTVVTNDLQIAAYLERNAYANIIMAGGAVRRNFHCTAGQKALDTIIDLNVDKAFVGVNGVSLERGLSTPNIDTANVKTAIINISDETFLLADSSKFNKNSFVKFADIEEIQVVITDDELDGETLESIRSLGIAAELCKAKQ